MVDSLKDLTSFRNPASGTAQNDSLRKNLKAISSVSVSRATDTAVDAQKTSAAQQAQGAVGNITDAIQLSADALRTLSVAAEGNAETGEVAKENLTAATATPEDLEKAQQRASDTGVAIQFRHDEALYAHGRSLTSEIVYRLTAD